MARVWIRCCDLQDRDHHRVAKVWHAYAHEALAGWAGAVCVHPHLETTMSNPDLNAFAKYIPGFEFLQNLTRQTAGSVAPGLQSGVPGMPQLSHWVAPTFDVEELDKRIQDLRAVHFWLDQNTKALGATIQALEVQKMTLATLKGMNVSMAEMAEAFKIKPEQAQVKNPEPEPSPAPVAACAPAASPVASADDTQAESTSGPQADPMQWWNALTQQFQTIAGSALQDMAAHASRAAEQVVQTVQAGAEAASQMATSDPTPAAPTAKAARAAVKKPTATKPSRTPQTPAKAAGKTGVRGTKPASPARKTG